MSTEIDQRIASLAAEIDQIIPNEGGFVTSTRYRDDIVVEGNRAGLLAFGAVLLLQAIGDGNAPKLQQRVARMVPGGSVAYLGASLVTPNEITKRQRAGRFGIGCTITMIVLSLLVLGLAIVGMVTAVRWVI